MKNQECKYEVFTFMKKLILSKCLDNRCKLPQLIPLQRQTRNKSIVP